MDMDVDEMLENSNPQIYKKSDERIISEDDEDDDITDVIDAREIFDIIKGIKDPEHPLSLEELNVVRLDRVSINNATNNVSVQFSPTVPHCSMATLIGLSIRVQLLRALPARLKVTVLVTPGTHASELAVNKQLNDKERVAAALENNHLMEVINQCIADSFTVHGG